jgi:hypothetical protein
VESCIPLLPRLHGSCFGPRAYLLTSNPRRSALVRGTVEGGCLTPWLVHARQLPTPTLHLRDTDVKQRVQRPSAYGKSRASSCTKLSLCGLYEQPERRKVRNPYSCISPWTSEVRTCTGDFCFRKEKSHDGDHCFYLIIHEQALRTVLTSYPHSVRVQLLYLRSKTCGGRTKSHHEQPHCTIHLCGTVDSHIRHTPNNPIFVYPIALRSTKSKNPLELLPHNHSAPSEPINSHNPWAERLPKGMPETRVDCTMYLSARLWSPCRGKISLTYRSRNEERIEGGCQGREVKGI